MSLIRVTVSSALIFCVTQASSQAVDETDDELLFTCETFPRSLSEDGLRARFGTENVLRTDIVGRDDGPQDGTILFPDDPARRVFIFWSDPASRDRPGWIWVRDPDSRWRNVDGFSNGDGLLEIEQANGWPFRLRPLTFESAGRVLSWGRGRLTDPQAGMPECSLTISFGLRPDPDQDRLLVRQVTSMRIRELPREGLSSGHPAFQELDPVINWMSISYPLIR